MKLVIKQFGLPECGCLLTLARGGFFCPLSYYFILALVDPCCVTQELCLYNNVLLFAFFPPDTRGAVGFGEESS